MQRIFRTGSLFVLSLLVSSSSIAASRITAIDFRGTQNPSEIEIKADGPLEFEKIENEIENQVVIELRNAQISPSNSRKIDTSSFDGNVSLITPYQVADQPDTVRVVIQMRGAGTSNVTSSSNSVKVTIPSGDGFSLDPPPIDGNAAVNNEMSSVTEMDSSIMGSGGSTSTSKESLDAFDDTTTMSDKKQSYVGSPITLRLSDADIRDVLQLISDASGFNILISEEVKGKLTLSLVDVPWDHALDVILKTLKLGAERNQNVLRVIPLSELTAEKKAIQQAAALAKVEEPLVTKIFPVNYADPEELARIVAEMLSSDASAQQTNNNNPQFSTSFGPTPNPGDPQSTTETQFTGNVQIDKRTNSIIARDYQENIERIEQLIKSLDTQTPQVVIEAKVVEALEGFSRSLTGSLGVADNPTTPSLFASFAGGNPIDPLVGDPGIFSTGLAISSTSSPDGAPSNGTFAFSPTLSFIPGSPRLNAILSWGESENQLKVVTAPKTVVLNKQQARIVQGTPVLVPSVSFVAGVGSVPTAEVREANVSMEVTPSVTNDSSILLQLTVSKDVPVALAGGQQGIGTRNMTTNVIVESGSTLVIGGIYSMQTTTSESGIPYLRNIPIIGSLFGSESESVDRSELFIFVTPRILNTRQAGLSG